MSDKDNPTELEEQYNLCQKMAERYEHINKEFKPYEEYYSKLQGLYPTVERVINSDDTMIDLFTQNDTESDFYDAIEVDTSIESTESQSD